MAFRPRSVAIQEDRLREAIRVPPSELVQHLPRGRHADCNEGSAFQCSRRITGKAISRGSVPRPMEYPPAVEKLFKKAGAAIGDTVAVTTPDKRFEGVAMPHPAFSGVDVLTVKLANGYNVGIAVADITKLELVSKQTPTARKAAMIPTAAGKPTIAVLGTGGTIASYVDYRTGAVHPAGTPGGLVFSRPELLDAP